jgi:hypothetical protein
VEGSLRTHLRRGEILVWKECGYFSFTKKGDRVLIVVKHQKYVADIRGVKAVLAGKQGYTFIYQPSTEMKPT